MVKKQILRSFTSLRGRSGLALAALLARLRARAVPVHACTGRRPAENGVFR